jgi:hypothetical protein
LHGLVPIQTSPNITQYEKVTVAHLNTLHMHGSRIKKLTARGKGAPANIDRLFRIDIPRAGMYVKVHEVLRSPTRATELSTLVAAAGRTAAQERMPRTCVGDTQHVGVGIKESE